MTWNMEAPAFRLCEFLQSASAGKLPHEILRIDADTAAIIADIDGVDYVLTVQVVPRQRPRPTEN